MPEELKELEENIGGETPEVTEELDGTEEGDVIAVSSADMTARVIDNFADVITDVMGIQPNVQQVRILLGAAINTPIRTLIEVAEELVIEVSDLAVNFPYG